MTDSEPDDPLLEWNRLNKENAEHGFVSALYQSMSETSPLVEKFSVWLLAGTGATAALLITQIESILPYLSEPGFKACLIVIVLSAIAGFVAKYYSLRCEIQNGIQSKLTELVKPVLDKHEADEEKNPGVCQTKRYCAADGARLLKHNERIFKAIPVLGKMVNGSQGCQRKWRQTSRVPHRCESIHVTDSVDLFSGRVVFGFHTDGRMVRKCHITKQLNTLPVVAGRSFLAPFIAGVSGLRKQR